MMFSPELNSVMESIVKEGGVPYVVGGFVRDTFLHLSNYKDVDVEVFGLDSDQLFAILSKFGPVTTAGKAFGVYILNVNGTQVEFAIARMESKIGAGHQGFKVVFDKNLTMKQAASRRDFTMNAMYMSPITGEFIDMFGGAEDLHNHVLRAVSPAFKEDPLRVLRAMRFCGQFDLIVEPTTMLMCQEMFADYGELPKERIWHEWEAWALKSTVPSRGLDVLRWSGWIKAYPELNHYGAIEWYRLGAAMNHAVTNYFQPEDRVCFLMAMLCSDLDPLGVNLFLYHVGAPKKVEKMVHILVKNRNVMKKYGNVRRVSMDIAPLTLQQLCIFTKGLSRTQNQDVGHDIRQAVNYNLNSGSFFKCLDKPFTPRVTGQMVMDAGVKAGPIVGKILSDAFEAEMNEDIMTQYSAKQWLVKELKKLDLYCD